MDIDDQLSSIAVLVSDSVEGFQVRAQEVAAGLGPESIPELKKRYHRHPDPPDGFGFEEVGLGGWLSFWQFAIFEVLFNIGEPAIPELRRVAFGEYDWTQANAVEVLCRLAADGIARDQTIADLKQKMPAMRDTALLYIVGPLLKQAEDNQDLAAIVSELRTIEEFENAVEELQESENA